MSLAEIADVTGGSIPDRYRRDAGLVVDGPVVTDSRQAGPGGLYVARIGAQADGHAFVAAAREAGAVAALTSRPVDELPGVVVDDVDTAFGRLARGVLDRAPHVRVVAITGSSGKTSTKDMLGQVLSSAGPTVAPVESYNGEIGVPLTVCRVDTDTRYLVVEMGARGIGHVRYLTSIAPPHVSVVLNVGSAHLGEFGSREAIALAKGEIVEALAPDGVAVLNADDPLVLGMATRTSADVVTVGTSPQAVVRATDIVLDEQGRADFTVHAPSGSGRVRLALHGAHHVGNALAVVAAASALGLSLPEILAGIGSAHAVSRWRMEVTERPDGVTVVNDAYNANPESMAAALRSLSAMTAPAAGRPRRRAVAVLGEMLELGSASVAAHLDLGRAVAAAGVDHLVVVGEGARPVGDAATEAGVAAQWVPDTDAAYDVVERVVRAGDVVLLKSSNAVGLRLLGDRLARRQVPA